MRRLHSYILKEEPQRHRGFKEASLKRFRFVCPRYRPREESAVLYPGRELQGTRQDWFRTIVEDVRFPAIVLAGHYIPDLLDFDKMPKDAVESAKLGFALLESLRFHGPADFLLYVNDIHVPALPKQSKVQNPYREMLYNPFVPPAAIRELMARHRVRELRYEGEKSNYNSYTAHVRRHVEKLDFVERESSGLYRVQTDGVGFSVFDEPDSKCVGAVAWLFKLLAENGYQSCIFLYPNCTRANLERALRVSSNTFGIDFSRDMDTYLVFMNHSCYK
jgi:hypothetical protein